MTAMVRHETYCRDQGLPPLDPRTQNTRIQNSEYLLHGTTKTEAAGAEAWAAPVAVGDAQNPGYIDPRTAAHDPVLSSLRTLRIDNAALLVIIRRVPILHPLPHIAVHVVEAPCIGLQLPY